MGSCGGPAAGGDGTMAGGGACEGRALRRSGVAVPVWMDRRADRQAAGAVLDRAGGVGAVAAAAGVAAESEAPGAIVAVRDDGRVVPAAGGPGFGDALAIRPNARPASDQAD